MMSFDLYDMSSQEREDFENDCASAWVDRKRDQELEEMEERKEQLRRRKEERDELLHTSNS